MLELGRDAEIGYDLLEIMYERYCKREGLPHDPSANLEEVEPLFLTRRLEVEWRVVQTPDGPVRRPVVIGCGLLAPNPTRVVKSSTKWIHRHKNWILEYTRRPGDGYVLARAAHTCGNKLLFDDDKITVVGHRMDHHVPRLDARYYRFRNGAMMVRHGPNALLVSSNGAIRGFSNECLRFIELRATEFVHLSGRTQQGCMTSIMGPDNIVVDLMDRARGGLVRRTHPDGRVSTRAARSRAHRAIHLRRRRDGATFGGSQGNEHIVRVVTPNGTRSSRVSRGRSTLSTSTAPTAWRTSRARAGAAHHPHRTARSAVRAPLRGPRQE